MKPRLSLKARVEALFRAHPNEWISSFDLQRVGGAMASRTRISEVRRSGMKITNRCRRIETPTGPQTVSEYRYEPPLPTQPRLAWGDGAYGWILWISIWPGVTTWPQN
jgi:hypothetical protein